jgi:hypothetical protein
MQSGRKIPLLRDADCIHFCEKMDALGCSKMLVDSYQAVWCHIQGDVVLCGVRIG